MATFESIQRYQAHNAKRAEAIRTNLPKTAENAAIFTAAKARAYAPMKTGRLRRGIVRRKNVVTARASNPGKDGRFPYIHWVNRTPGKGMINLRMKRNKITGQFAKVKELNEGDGPIFVATYGTRPSGWFYTGRAGFFKQAVKEGRQHFGRALTEATKKSLRAEFI